MWIRISIARALCASWRINDGAKLRSGGSGWSVVWTRMACRYSPWGLRDGAA